MIGRRVKKILSRGLTAHALHAPAGEDPCRRNLGDNMDSN